MRNPLTFVESGKIAIFARGGFRDKTNELAKVKLQVFVHKIPKMFVNEIHIQFRTY